MSCLGLCKNYNYSYLKPKNHQKSSSKSPSGAFEAQMPQMFVTFDLFASGDAAKE